MPAIISQGNVYISNSQLYESNFIPERELQQ